MIMRTIQAKQLAQRDKSFRVPGNSVVVTSFLIIFFMKIRVSENLRYILHKIHTRSSPNSKFIIILVFPWQSPSNRI